jgi:ATP-dependent Clp endopeptidase proteolytic subunit ClpP
MKEAYIRFMAPVLPQTSDQLFRIIDAKIKDKCKKLHIMISSPGGSVFHGISIYNFLRGAPIEVETYNFGSVDSIGVVVFCAGKHRSSVPHARFLIHGVRFNVGGPQAFDEKQLEEHLKGIKIDQTNIARIIADTSGKPLHKVEEDMSNRITLSPTEGKDYGLVHEIKSALFPIDADLSVIGEIAKNQQQGVPIPFGITLQPAQAYTRSADLDFRSF